MPSWVVLAILMVAAALMGACFEMEEDDTVGGQQPIVCDEDADCPAGSWCEEARCEEVLGCPDIWAPVCDTEGRTWDNACTARLERVVIAHEGVCRSGTGSAPSCADLEPVWDCREQGCASGERCVAPPGDGSVCLSSSCFCDEEEAIWICTDDCGGWHCVGDASSTSGTRSSDPHGTDSNSTGSSTSGTSSACSDDEKPVWDCRDQGCASGERCVAPPGDGLVCVPSNCFCDADEGQWICTEDCGGWYCEEDSSSSSSSSDTCTDPNPAGCVETGCPEGQFCTTLLDVCVSSSCFCDPETDSWGCTDDCGGGVCVEELPCADPNPAGCSQEGCDEGDVCKRADDECAPSICACDADSGHWLCTMDCGGGGTCVPVGSGPCGPNPAGCTQEGCDEGETCDRSDVTCAPSECWCDEDAGQWACTRDCGGGGVCVPDGTTCRKDRDCEVGELCLDGSCEGVACIMIYDPVCGVDGRTYGNACLARVAHVDIAHEGECEAREEGCDTPNPAGCTQEGCGEGEICDRSGVDCAPSSCFCSGDGGQWACTRDCGGGGVCIPEESADCRIDTDCKVGSLCLGGSCEEVACITLYDPVCGVDGRTYGNACEAQVAHVEIDYYGACRDEAAGCDTPNPAGCTQEGCDLDEYCDTSDVDCAPSSCFCTGEGGQWACTRDCGGGGVCVTTH